MRSDPCKVIPKFVLMVCLGVYEEMALKKWKDEMKKMEDFRKGELSGDYYYFYYKIPIIGRNSKTI